MVDPLTGYSFCKKITIHPTTAGALTNYVKKIRVVKAAGTDYKGKVCLGGEPLNWPNDIRFTAADGTTLLDFYRFESDATDGTWYVEINSISSSVDTDIYIHYGDADATDASSGADTFQHWDNFETNDFSRWTSAGSIWSTQTTKYEGTYAAKCYDITTNQRSLVKTLSNGSTKITAWVRHESGDTFYLFRLEMTGGAIVFPLAMVAGAFKYFPGGAWTALPTATSYSNGTWYQIEVVLDFEQSLFRWWINGVSKGTATLKDQSGNTLDSDDSLASLVFYGCSTSGTTGYLDQVCVQDYIYPEPEWDGEDAPAPLTIQAYGDSIMYGHDVDPTQAHVYLTAQYLEYSLNNNGEDSYGAADIAHSAGLYARAIAINELYLMQGFPNDTYAFHENANGPDIYKAGITAIAAQCLIPDSAKVYANAATLGGTWTDPTIYNRSKKSIVNGSTASFSVSGDTIVIATTRLVTNPGSFTVTIDSQDKGTIALSPCAANNLGLAFCPQVNFYESLGAGSHTVVLTAVSDGTTIAQVDWVAGFTKNSISSTWPVLVFGGHLRCVWPGYTPFTEAEGAEYAGYVEDVYDTLKGYGFNIFFVELWSKIAGNTTNFINGDYIHPTVAGHVEISEEFLAQYFLLTTGNPYYAYAQMM